MADSKITDLTAITSGVASTDVTVLVDVSDTSMAASGTDKKITVGDLATAIISAGSLATDAEVASAISALSAVYQPLDSDLTAIAALTTTTFGRSLLALADAAAGRTALGLVIGTDVAAQSSLASYQPLDSDLTAIAALTTTSFGRSLLALADAAAGRTALGLAAIAASGSASDLSSGTVATARLGSGTADGTTFLRGDGTWNTPAGGGNVPARIIPATGQWIGPATSTFSTAVGGFTAANGHNRTVFGLVQVDYTVSVDQISLEITIAGDASSVVRIGLWSDSNGRPGTLLEQGTAAADSTGVKSVSFTARSLSPGLYWTGHAWQSGIPTTQITYRSYTGIGASYAHGYGTDNGISNQWPLMYHDTSGAFADSPTVTFGSGTSFTSPARILLRVA